MRLIINYCFDARDLEFVASNALGIGAASFWSAAEKDIAESPTASPERPNRRQKVNKTTRLQVLVRSEELGVVFAVSHEI